MLNPDPLRGAPGPRPWIAGICADLAAEFNLPVLVVRCIALVLATVPTGITYVLLALLSGRRRGRLARAWDSLASTTQPNAPVLGREYGAVRQRFAAMESRLAAIEAFVSSKDFELHKGFSQMRD